MGSLGLRMLKRIGESSFWKHWGRSHAWLYRRTGGRIGHRMAGVTALLLTTTGRRSGEGRTVAVTYVADGRNYVVYASNGGADRHPAWWLNLRKTPRARIQVGDVEADVVAREADAAERSRLLPRLTGGNLFWASYERMTSRPIPVVILEPVKGEQTSPEDAGGDDGAHVRRATEG